MPDELKSKPLAATMETVRQLFELLIRRSTKELKESDLIRFYIRADQLDKPISTELMTVSALTIEKLLSTVMNVLQSKEEISLDGGFLIDIITIRREVGAGGRKITNIEIDRLKNKSVLTIPYDTKGLCCAKAILYALAHVERDQKAINAMRDIRRPALKTRAEDLHRAAGVPIGPCTFADIAIFEKHLNVQVVVISTQNMNKVSSIF